MLALGVLLSVVAALALCGILILFLGDFAQAFSDPPNTTGPDNVGLRFRVRLHRYNGNLDRHHRIRNHANRRRNHTLGRRVA